jgi:GH15 family glucan-1,4-alpha-glucosidase
MYRLYQHVKGDNGHIAEQIDRSTGAQKSAKDLTWSYANILSAMQFREKASIALTKLRQTTETL